MRCQAAHSQAPAGIQPHALPRHQHVYAPHVLHLAQRSRQRQAQRIKSPVSESQCRAGEIHRCHSAAQLKRILRNQAQDGIASEAVDLLVSRIAQQFPRDGFQRLRLQDSRDALDMLGHEIQPVLSRQVQSPQPRFSAEVIPIRRRPPDVSNRQIRCFFFFIFNKGTRASAETQQRRCHHQADDPLLHAFAPPFPFLGRVTVKQLPCPGSLATLMFPPCILTSWRTILSPSPVPPVSRLRALSTR